jgi:hypothetical protein
VVTVPGGSRRSVGTNPGRPSLLALSAAGAYWATVPTAPQPSTISDGGPAVATVPGELTDLVAGADAVYAVVRADATTTHPVRVRFSAGAPPSVDTLRGAPQPRSGIAAAAGHAYWFEDHDVTCAPVARLMISE